MVLEAGVPIVPVAMVHTEKILPIGRTFPRILRPGIVFGKPLDFSRFAGLEGDRFILRSVTDELMYELQKLSEQQYVDVYATTVKDKLASVSR